MTKSIQRRLKRIIASLKTCSAVSLLALSSACAASVHEHRPPQIAIGTDIARGFIQAYDAAVAARRFDVVASAWLPQARMLIKNPYLRQMMGAGQPSSEESETFVRRTETSGTEASVSDFIALVRDHARHYEFSRRDVRVSEGGEPGLYVVQSRFRETICLKEVPKTCTVINGDDTTILSINDVRPMIVGAVQSTTQPPGIVTAP